MQADLRLSECARQAHASRGDGQHRLANVEDGEQDVAPTLAAHRGFPSERFTACQWERSVSTSGRSTRVRLRPRYIQRVRVKKRGIDSEPNKDNTKGCSTSTTSYFPILENQSMRERGSRPQMSNVGRMKEGVRRAHTAAQCSSVFPPFPQETAPVYPPPLTDQRPVDPKLVPVLAGSERKTAESPGALQRLESASARPP